jgi:Homeodomain-like domain-containing protein
VEALDLLASGKSVREVAAATGLSKSKVRRLRSKYSGQSGTPAGHLDRSPPTPEVSQAAVAPPVTARRGFERVPEINSLWFSDLSEAERTRFVDAVGLWNLLLAAPEDHREAFLDRLQSWLRAEGNRIRNPAARSAPGSGFPDLPDFLDRRRGGRS